MGAVRSVAGAVISWLLHLGRGIVGWAFSLIAYLPRRVSRVGISIVGLGRPVRQRMSPKQAGAALVRAATALLASVFDVVGGPELLQTLNRAITKHGPLTADEIAAAGSVLGEASVRWGDVRIAEGGLLGPVFRLNHHRAFTAWHTINLPTGGNHVRSNKALIVHELVHVLQYERLGSIYIGQALHAQATTGYDYGGSGGLEKHRRAGGRYRDFNREQQAQLVQHYFELRSKRADVSAYESYIAELRVGDI